MGDDTVRWIVQLSLLASAVGFSLAGLFFLTVRGNLLIGLVLLLVGLGDLVATFVVMRRFRTLS